MGSVDSNPLVAEQAVPYEHVLGQEIPPGTMCERCTERPAEVTFYPHATSVMDVVHGGVGKPYCKVCVTECQIEYEMKRSTLLTRARNVLADLKGEGPRYIPLAEFRDVGYLQEINRLFLHPLGLAMEIYIDDETGEGGFVGIWDCRHDPEGITFAPDMISIEKAQNVKNASRKFQDARRTFLGHEIQPLPRSDV